VDVSGVRRRCVGRHAQHVSVAIVCITVIGAVCKGVRRHIAASSTTSTNACNGLLSQSHSSSPLHIEYRAVELGAEVQTSSPNICGDIFGDISGDIYSDISDDIFGAMSNDKSGNIANDISSDIYDVNIWCMLRT
jgi:hypothetical protein